MDMAAVTHASRGQSVSLHTHLNTFTRSLGAVKRKFWRDRSERVTLVSGKRISFCLVSVPMFPHGDRRVLRGCPLRPREAVERRCVER